MGPSYVTHRPLRFVPEGQEPSSADALRVLTAVATLEHTEPAMRNESSDVSPELQDIRARLDLLVALVSQLHMRDSQGQLPARVEVTISAEKIQWESSEPTNAGPGVLELYLSDAYPEPLRLSGELELRMPDSDGQALHAFCFLPKAQDEDVDDAWQRHVFRHHRREIARKQAHPVAR